MTLVKVHMLLVSNDMNRNAADRLNQQLTMYTNKHPFGYTDQKKARLRNVSTDSDDEKQDFYIIHTTLQLFRCVITVEMLHTVA